MSHGDDLQGILVAYEGNGAIPAPNAPQTQPGSQSAPDVRLGADPDRHLRSSDYCVLPVSKRICERLVAAYHYSGGGSNAAVFRHGLFERGNILECLGVAQWIPPTRNAARASWDGDWRNVLALSRLAIRPALPTNAASYLIAKSIRLIRADGRWGCLVTYADTWQGHDGSIYRATNWEYIGLTVPQRRFVDPRTGRLVSDYFYGKGRTAAEMRALGYDYLGRFPSHKYRMILPPPRRTAAKKVAA